MKIIDMHCDTLIECWRDKDRSLFDGGGHLNLKLMKENQGMAQFFAIYLSRREMEFMDSYDLFNKIYENYITEMENNKDIILPAFSAADIIANSESGKLSSFLTIEDGVFLDGKLERLEEVYKKGVRLVTLLWNFENSVGFPCRDNYNEHMKGLKPFGLEVVEESNRLGMLVDVSHMSEGGFYDVAKHSKKPFVASHSCAKTLCNHRRNLTDDQIKTLGNCGGVVGVNFECSFLKEGSQRATIQQIIDHMRYIVNKGGIDILGFGSDFDGIDDGGEMEGYGGYPCLLAQMEKYFTDDEIDKICNGNVLRVLRDVIGK